MILYLYIAIAFSPWRFAIFSPIYLSCQQRGVGMFTFLQEEAEAIALAQHGRIFMLKSLLEEHQNKPSAENCHTWHQSQRRDKSLKKWRSWPWNRDLFSHINWAVNIFNRPNTCIMQHPFRTSFVIEKPRKGFLSAHGDKAWLGCLPERRCFSHKE